MTSSGTGMAQWDRPLRPGLPVSATRGLAGTAGAITREPATGRLLLLGAGHVMTSGQDAALWQPTPCVKSGCTCNQVGSVERARQGCVEHAGHQYFVDVAVATIEADVPLDTRIAGVAIVGVTRAERGMRVWKLGAATGRTEGVVLDERHVEIARTAAGDVRAVNQILIRALGGRPVFSLVGDSGALVMDEKNRAVGMLWGASPSGDAVACHLEPALDALAIEVAAEVTRGAPALPGAAR